MNELPSLEHEPEVIFAQDSGCMLVSVGLAGKVSLEGKVSYPYLPNNGDRDHENGKAEIHGFSAVPSLSEADGIEGLNKIFITFLRNVTSLSAKTLSLRLRSGYPEWLIRGLFAFLNLNSLEVSSIKSEKLARLVTREAFEKTMQNYLPATIVIDLKNAIRAEI